MKTEEIVELKNKILEANAAYRAGNSIMSDAGYDELVEQYQKNVSEDEFNKFRDSLNEGFLVTSDRKKLQHKFIAGSLDKLKYEEPKDVQKFIKKILKTCLNVSAKVDGLSGIAKYENGKLVSLGTRGDGYVGEDITEKAPFIKFLPQEIPCKDELFVRGELVILKSDFDKVDGNAARNIVSGLIGRKEWESKDIKNISFIAYTVLGDKYPKDEQFLVLERNGFKTAWYDNFTKEVIESFEEKEGLVEKLFELASQEFDYETDGLVISDSTYRNESEYRPKKQRAFKINMMKFETRLLDIEWNGPSKDGVFVPVGILEPVDCNGAMVGRCTLHNLDFIEKKGLKLGAKVNILRSGDVIPKLINVVGFDEKCSEIEFPETCTCCGSKLVRDGVNFRCVNKACKDQTTSQVVHFIRKFGVEFANFKTLQKLGIYDISSLLAFRANESYKSEIKLANELKKKVFTQSKTALLAAMNFHGIGETIATKIIEHFGYERIAENPEVVKEGDLPDGVGDSFIQKFLDDVQENLKLVNMVLADSRYNYQEIDPGITGKKEKTESKGSVCFTGALSISRGEASKMAVAAGYEVKGGVSKGLTYLVTNTPDSGSTKNRKAKELGTKVITEEEFMKIIKSDSTEGNLEEL